MKQWKCTICGYIHSGDEPPEECPVCGADKTKFVLIESGETTEATIADDQTTVSVSGQEEDAGPKIPFAEIADRLHLLTRLHGHPIAVHIPNGVLPLTVLLTLLAVIFKSESLAIAAKFNMIFVCLSMPVVLFTGFVDWVNRFDGRMTKVFQTKIICGGIVTLLTLILTIWWLVQPDIYLGGSPGLVLFIFLYLMDFGAAAVAGYYRGKLVFKA